MHQVRVFQSLKRKRRRNIPSLTLQALIIFSLAGCGKPAVTTTKGDTTAAKAAVDFDALRENVRQSASDPASLQSALAQLNEASTAEPDRKPAPLPAADVAAMRDVLHIGDADLAEINRTDFTGLDAAELHQDFYFKDVARTLEV